MRRKMSGRAWVWVGPVWGWRYGAYVPLEGGGSVGYDHFMGGRDEPCAGRGVRQKPLGARSVSEVGERRIWSEDRWLVLGLRMDGHIMRTTADTGVDFSRGEWEVTLINAWD
ncbi:hypothetical protein WJX79_000315 [Trebouxia sp. C0005]